MQTLFIFYIHRCTNHDQHIWFFNRSSLRLNQQLKKRGGFMFVRTENPSTFFRLYPIVSFLVLIHIVFFLIFLIPGSFSNNLLKALIGFNLVIFKGEYWRLITPLFLHVHLVHMLVNSVSLILFGPALEKILGKWRFFLAYIGGGILANIATLFLAPPMYTHLGASGAVFSLFGIYSYLAFFHQHIIQRPHAHIIFAILLIGFVVTLTGANLNIIAHFFGFLSGAIIAPFIASHPNPYHP
jgi:rhomboid protease GluP